MFLKSLMTVTLFTSLLATAGPSDSDIFDVRSFRDPQTKKKIPITGQLFSNGQTPLQLFSDKVPKLLTVPNLLTEELKKNDKCAIPLLELKVGKTGDKMAKLVGPARTDSSSVMPPPLPACEGWNQGQNRFTVGPFPRWR